MAKSRPPYPPAFRRQRVELARTGRTPEELAREWRVVVRMTPNKYHFISESYDTHRISLGLELVPARKPAQAAFQLRGQVERAERCPDEVEVTALGQRHVQVLANPRRSGPEAGLGHAGDLKPVHA